MTPEKLRSELIYVGNDASTKKMLEATFPFKKFENPKWFLQTNELPDFEFLTRLYDEVLIVDSDSVQFPQFSELQKAKLSRLKIILISKEIPEVLPSFTGVISWVPGPFTKASWDQPISQLSFYVPTTREIDQLDPENHSSLFVILQNLKDDIDRKVAITDDHGIQIVNLDKILYCFSDQSYSQIISEKREPILSSKSLKFYEKVLGGPNFFRAHNQYLINLQHIESYQAAEGVIRMENGMEIQLSTRKKREFLRYIINAF